MSPLAFEADMIAMVETAAQKAAHASRRIVSDAFHDALFVARIAPSAVIFVPCRNGISRNEVEGVELRFTDAGTVVLLQATLAGGGDAQASPEPSLAPSAR